MRRRSRVAGVDFHDGFSGQPLKRSNHDMTNTIGPRVPDALINALIAADRLLAERRKRFLVS